MRCVSIETCELRIKYALCWSQGKSLCHCLRPAPETKSDRGAVAALGRQGAPLEAQGAVPGRRRQGAPAGYPAGLMIDRPAPETKSDRGAVAAHGRQGALYFSAKVPPTNRRSQVLESDWFIEHRGGACGPGHASSS